jgi:hypothetical protein
MPIEGFLDSPRKGDETSARSDDNLGNPILPSSSPSEWPSQRPLFFCGNTKGRRTPALRMRP